MPSQHHPAGRQSELRAGRVSEALECYAITKIFLGREDRGSVAATFGIITDSFKYLRQADRIKLYAFCLMPDHMHLAFCLMPGETLSGVVASFSKYTAARINAGGGRRGTVWQNGFHDRRCRNADELADIAEYIEHNPVRAGLVASADKGAGSSAHPGNQDLLDREWWP